MTRLDQLVLISTMTQSLDGLSVTELASPRLREAAYTASDAWGDLSLMPSYEFEVMDEAARHAQTMRRAAAPTRNELRAA